MPIPLAALLASPDHYLHGIEGQDAVFVRMNAQTYQRSIFLDHRIVVVDPQSRRVPLSALPADLERLPTSWIFHMAHCGSTLLARALDELSEGLVLREPLALRQIALSGKANAALKPALALLSRRYDPAIPSLIKANVPVNFLLPEIVAADQSTAALFLYLRLPDYCLAILRSDQHRVWLRSISALLSGRLGSAPASSDAELAARLWSAQLKQFAQALSAMPNAATLDAEILLNRPEAVLPSAGAALGRPCPVEAVGPLVSGPMFRTYAKNPALAFDNEARLARQVRLAEALVAEVDEAKAWAARYAPDAEPSLAAIHRAALVL